MSGGTTTTTAAGGEDNVLESLLAILRGLRLPAMAEELPDRRRRRVFFMAHLLEP